MRIGRGLLAALALTAAALPVAGQTPQQLKFTSPGSVIGSYSGYGSYYVGPYQATVLSQPGTPTLDIYCVDFLHSISLGYVWTAGFRSLAGDLTGTRGGNSAAVDYLKAAWLASQFAVSNPAEWKNIQATMWNLFAPTAPDPTAYGAHASNHWLQEATTNYQTVNPNYWYVVTDVASPGTQEFLTYVTPEPSTYLLLATGLFFLGFMYLRRTQPGVIRT